MKKTAIIKRKRFYDEVNISIGSKKRIEGVPKGEYKFALGDHEYK